MFGTKVRVGLPVTLAAGEKELFVLKNACLGTAQNTTTINTFHEWVSLLTAEWVVETGSSKKLARVSQTPTA